MKKAIIIVLAILIAIDGGLLGYGICLGTGNNVNIVNEGLLAAPSETVWSEADTWYLMADILNDMSLTKEEKVANMLIKATYNHIYCSQYYFIANVVVEGDGTSAYSQYFRAQQGANSYYQTLAYTGSINPAIRRVYYNKQKFEQKNQIAGVSSYDSDTNTYSARWPNSISVGSSSNALAEESTYLIYSWFDFPLDLGDRNTDNDKPIDKTLIDASLIIASTVQITKPTTDAPYYTIKFDANTTASKESAETVRRFKDGKGISNLSSFEQHSFEIELWPQGLFRQMTYSSRIVATVGGKTGDATFKNMLQFSYDDADCSVAKHMGADMVKKLSDENKVVYDAEMAEFVESEEGEEE